MRTCSLGLSGVWIRPCRGAAAPGHRRSIEPAPLSTNGLRAAWKGEQVMAMFAEKMGVKVISRHAEDNSSLRLLGVTDPERSAKIIGAPLSKSSTKKSDQLQGVRIPGPGHHLPDVIDPRFQERQRPHLKSKSPHNVGGFAGRIMLLSCARAANGAVQRMKCARSPGAGFRTTWSTASFPGPGLGVPDLAESAPRSTPTFCAG